MANLAENLPDPEPLPLTEPLTEKEYNFAVQAVYDVANKLGGTDLASSVTAWGLDQAGRPPKIALAMLEYAQTDAKEMIENRIAELKQIAEQQTSLVRRFGNATIQRVRDLF